MLLPMFEMVARARKQFGKRGVIISSQEESSCVKLEKSLHPRVSASNRSLTILMFTANTEHYALNTMLPKCPKPSFKIQFITPAMGAVPDIIPAATLFNKDDDWIIQERLRTQYSSSKAQSHSDSVPQAILQIRTFDRMGIVLDVTFFLLLHLGKEDVS